MPACSLQPLPPPHPTPPHARCPPHVTPSCADAASEKAQLTEACLDQHVLRQAAVPGAQAPGDPYYHLGQTGNAFTYRMPYQLPQASGAGVAVRAAGWAKPTPASVPAAVRNRLITSPPEVPWHAPQNLTCDGQTAKCVLQWYYLTGEERANRLPQPLEEPSIELGAARGRAVRCAAQRAAASPQVPPDHLPSPSCPVPRQQLRPARRARTVGQPPAGHLRRGRRVPRGEQSLCSSCVFLQADNKFDLMKLQTNSCAPAMARRSFGTAPTSASCQRVHGCPRHPPRPPPRQLCRLLHRCWIPTPAAPPRLETPP